MSSNSSIENNINLSKLTYSYINTNNIYENTKESINSIKNNFKLINDELNHQIVLTGVEQNNIDDLYQKIIDISNNQN